MSEKVAPSNSWLQLKQYTKARIALGNIGTGLPLNEVLALKHAHAMAKDAIVTDLDIKALQQKCNKKGITCNLFKSQARDRLQYLKRPDLGRRLNKFDAVETERVNILFVITDGLSAKAVNQNAFLVLDNLLPKIRNNYSFAIALVEQGRVAIGDELCEIYDADFVVVLIGERPGLSSPESMGIYTTYNAKIGFTDERRNCISNIHANGLNVKQASKLLDYLIQKSFSLKLSGIELKLEVGEILEN